MPAKMRIGPDGIQLFSRYSGSNLLLDEIVPPRSMWSAAPRQVSVALTNSCDLVCSYCYAPKTRASLLFDSLMLWLADLDANGTLGVGFGGGEPTLYARFAELCAHITRNTRLAVTFTTHGHHLSDTLIAQLKGSVHFCRVSMDGVGKTYERIRRRSFDALLTRLTSVGKMVPFGVNYVVNSRTWPDIDKAVELAQQFGAAEFLLLPEQPVRERGGIDSITEQALKRWVAEYRGGLRLAVSAKGSEGLPITDPFKRETGLRGFAHIDAHGILKNNSYDVEGVAIDSKGVLSALKALSDNSH